MSNDLLRQDFEGESETIHDMGKGIVAGLVATTAVAALVALKGYVGATPQFDPVAMLATMAHSASRYVGWLVFFGGGTIFLGVMFGLLDARVEATTGAGELVRGLLFAALTWLIFMLIFMPVYGVGVFGNALGLSVPALTFVAAVIYGLLLGAVYGALHPETVMT